ncbi:hypothetical protein TELCIR_16398 [Teladorsagia circumcincta]|uniref:Uncharacterized protein n=1 Tax=Teladorsagia circumcincta TaxID=45464 RepID=A0A2G9TXU1_TELCI|nr:hypothetical protein TELCIR_16398 [Teladorsagia circumcincta]
MLTIFPLLLLCFTITTSLDYREQLWVRNLQHTTYEYFLNNYQRLRKLHALKMFARGRTTPTPILAIPFFDNTTKTDEDANFVSLKEVFSPPRTVDDEIGLPLNEPLPGQKVSFNRYLNPYLQQRHGGK